MSNNSSNLVWSKFHETKYKQLFNKLYEMNKKIQEDTYLLTYNKKKLKLSKTYLYLIVPKSHFYLWLPDI